MADWTRIGPSLCIQNLCLYDKLNLPIQTHSDESTSQMFIASCPYAGPIAVAFPCDLPNAWTINIYMQNGVQIASLTANAIFRLFWSKCQKLLVISANGRVLMYDVLGKLLENFSMGDETLALGLLDAKIFSYANETGLAIFNNAKHFFAVNSVSTHLLWRIKDQTNETFQSLTCWAVLASAVKSTQVLLCSRTRFFLGRQDSNGVQLCNFFWARRDGQYIDMKPNNNNSKLLLLHDSNIVQLIDVEDGLQTELQQITLAHSDIKQLLWCSESAFGIQTKSEAEQLNIYSLDSADDSILPDGNDKCGDYFSFSFTTHSHFFSDVDGVHVFSQHLAHFLLPISESSKAVLGLGSNEPAALLFAAELKLEQRSHLAYEFIRSINANLMPTAIDHCLAAAAHHFDPKVQKQLLKAATIGIRRCDRPYDSDKFVRVCRFLRVLNALRLMGIPLTFTQFEELTCAPVIDRLVAFGHWPMAIKICEFLQMEPKEGVYKVLAHWCNTVMTVYKENLQNAHEKTTIEELAQRIISRHKQYPAINYADIAEMASRHDLPTLAGILLDLETNVSRQVTVMLKLKQLDKALQKAAQSQQPDLMHLVLRHLRNSASGRELEFLLRKVPQAYSIYQSEIRDEAPERLLALYEQGDDFLRQAIMYLQRAEQMSQDCFDTHRTTEQFAKAEKALKNMRDMGNAQLVAECSQLFVENAKREEKYSIPMTHMSICETFIWAVGHEELALLEQLRKQHRLSEKQVFYWTVEGFAKANKWQQFEQYARSRKSPMGYLPVIELCATYGNKNLGMRLINRLAGYEEQIQAYLELGEIKKASILAAEKLDLQTLQLIRRRFPPTSEHWAEVSKLMENVSKAK